MTTSTTSSTPSVTTVIPARFGLARPELEDARLAVRRIAPGRAERVWSEVQAGAEALAPGRPALRDVLDAMRLHPDQLVGLAAASLEVRLRTFEALAGQDLPLHR